ncbi:MAG TPA: FlgD immunoglobulin-like domain containing protein, partial [bacterium]
RGTIKPSLVGAYIYGDYETHRIWMLRYENGQVSQNQELVTADFGISSFGVDESNELYIVGYSLSGASGIYRFPDNPTAVNDKPENPERFVLEPNHPNPFNPLTRIRYRVPGFDDVQLAVFNALGRKIRTLISQQQGPGEFQVVWDGRDDGGEIVASGVYLYQLKIGDEQHVRKMTLIR